jgi:hypothetical protein
MLRAASFFGDGYILKLFEQNHEHRRVPPQQVTRRKIFAIAISANIRG